MAKYLFKESYMHRFAKQVIKKWLSNDKDIIRVDIEHPFYADSMTVFVPDLTVYKQNGIYAWIEIFHKNEIDGKKILEMQKYCYLNEIDVKLIEISAYWILSQYRQPDELKGMIIKLT